MDVPYIEKGFLENIFYHINIKMCPIRECTLQLKKIPEMEVAQFWASNPKLQLF